jgi:pyrroline-5-carboxylate reductase
MNPTSPVLLVGAGRLGSALIRGWFASRTMAPQGLIILDPTPGDEARTAAQQGARLNPSDEVIAAAQTVVLAVKPQAWRAIAETLAPKLDPKAVIVSVAAGVRTGDLAEAFGGRVVARTLPTTAVAIRQGAAAIYAPTKAGRRAAHAVLGAVATTVDLDEESQMDAVIGISGSAPGFFYAFVEALEAAGAAQGLPAEAAQSLARAAVAGAAALMTDTGETPSVLRAEVASPGGTTEAGLKALTDGDALFTLVARAVDAAAKRATELGD